MKSITINITEEKYNFFLELIASFDFVNVENEETIDEEDSEEEILANIKQGLYEMKLVEKGKLQARPAKDFLDEL